MSASRAKFHPSLPNAPLFPRNDTHIEKDRWNENKEIQNVIM